MDRQAFRAAAKRAAHLHSWTVEFITCNDAMEAWFYDANHHDVAQAYLQDGQDPIGLDALLVKTVICEPDPAAILLALAGR